MQLKSLVLTALLASAASSASFYKKTPVLELDSKNFDEVVLNTNQSSLIEFYAPWCGHCQRLKPEYEKVGKILNEVAIVGAVNCDLGKNKKLCARYRVEGFPSIMAFRAPKFDLNKPSSLKYGHASEVFNGPRKAKNLVDFMTARIKNYVKRLITLQKLNSWLTESSERPKMVVFTRKDKLTALLKSVAVDLLGAVDVAYVPVNNGKHEIFEEFEIDPNGTTSIVYFFDSKGQRHQYQDEFNKNAIFEYLSQFDELKNSTQKIFKKLDYLKKVQNGEKVKKAPEHDEL